MLVVLEEKIKKKKGMYHPSQLHSPGFLLFDKLALRVNICFR